MTRRARVSLGMALAIAGLAAACRDEPLSPAPAPVRRAVAVPIACVADRGAVSCNTGTMATATSPSLAAAEAMAHMPAAPTLARGGPHEATVRVFGTSTGGVEVSLGFWLVNATSVQYQVGVSNNSGQGLGTIDGEIAGPTGTRVGLVNGPTVVSSTGPGNVTPIFTDGTATFTAPAQPYWMLGATTDVIRPGEERTGIIGFDVPFSVTRFTFRLLLSTDLVDESESGLLRAPAGYASFATGGFGGCGVKGDGSLRCWGRNDEGQLANGRIDAFASVPQFGSGVQQGFALGEAHVCVSAIGTNTLSCAGSSSEGQAGIFNGAFLPFFSSGGSAPDMVDLAAGGANTCGIDETTRVASCWGDGRFGQLGTPITDAASPQDVSLPAGATVRRFSVGRDGTICAISLVDRAYCWGRNDAGQVGSGIAGADVLTRTEVVGGISWLALAVGARHVCGIERGTGNTFCWGASDFGQVGTVAASVPAPTLVANVPSAVAIAAGRDFTCVATGTNGVWCWGRNDFAQAGRGSESLIVAPGPASVGAGAWTQLVAGDRHACAASGLSVVCWGDNRRGQLGDAQTTGVRSTPGVTTTMNVGETLGPAGADVTCLSTDGGSGQFESRCFGSNAAKQVNADGGPPQLRPIGILSGIRWRTVGVGDGHACALNVNGAIYCWGRGYAGQLGDGNASARAQPQRIQPVAGDTVFRALTVGADHACAIRVSNDQLYCWGRNDAGQLGIGTRTAALAPAAVINGRFFSDVRAGRFNTCAWSDAGVSCWGGNAAGQLGIGSTTDELAPVVVLPGIIPPALAIGGDDDPRSAFICVAPNLTDVLCAGANGRAQLARGAAGAPANTFGPATALAPVLSMNSTTLELAAGRAHGCLGTGTLAYCWGAADDGQSSGPVTRDPLLVALRVDGLGEITRVAATGDRSCFEYAGRWRCVGGRNRLGEAGIGSVIPRQGGDIQ